MPPHRPTVPRAARAPEAAADLRLNALSGHDTHHALDALERDERGRIVPTNLLESLDGTTA